MPERFQWRYKIGAQVTNKNDHQNLKSVKKAWRSLARADGIKE
jgi:hypothetical protein